MLYISILCFVITSLLLVSGLWLGPVVPPLTILVLFAVGVLVLVVSTALEFVEMLTALETVRIEISDATGAE